MREGALSALERLGLEIVAFTMLGSRMQSAVLLTLLDANGRTASWETLAKARKWKMTENTEQTRNSIKVRISLLRESMRDLGFGECIVTMGCNGRHRHSDGYRITEADRAIIIDRLIQEASV